MGSSFYLDYNATTPLDPVALRAMEPFLTEAFGNPSSVHAFGRRTRSAVDEARDLISALIGAQSKELIFTSGGTESNNLAIFGVAHAQRSEGRHLITAATEHHAVLHPFKRLEEDGFEITLLPVGSRGRIDLNDLRKAIRPDTILVSIMSANNETGTRHPVSQIGRVCREHDILFHCDAIQSFGKENFRVDEWEVDLLSIGAHKFYGPKGVGALYVRSGTPCDAIQLGGFHENQRRAGTESVASIVGMAAAAAIASEKAESENCRLFELTESLWKLLEEAIPGIRRNGDSTERLGNTLNVSFEKCDGESLLMALDLDGIAASSGSACMVGSVQPSHVLQAMGLPAELIAATVRFSLGRDSRLEDLPEITARVARVVQRLRATK